MGSRGLKLLLAVLSMLLLPRCSGYAASRLAVQAARRPGSSAACSRLVCSGAVEAPTPTGSSAAAATAAGDAPKRQKVGLLLEEGESAIGRTVLLKGWVRTVRDQKNFSFVEVNDGSSLAGMQVVAMSDIESYGVVGELTTGAAVAVVGEVVASKGKGQTIEVSAQSVEARRRVPLGHLPAAEEAPLPRVHALHRPPAAAEQPLRRDLARALGARAGDARLLRLPRASATFRRPSSPPRTARAPARCSA